MANGLLSRPLDGWGLAVDFPAYGGRLRAQQSFIAGPENLVAVRALEEFAGDPAASSNALLLYGPPGTGKSHLARGLCATWKTARPRDHVECLAAAEFAGDYGESLQRGTHADWRGGFRRAAFVVLEDLGQLSGKHAVQSELTRIIDELLDSGGRLLVTSQLAPSRLPAFSARLTSRLSAGLCVPLAPPGEQARRTILRALAAQHGLELTADAARLLSAELAGTVPDLTGALRELQVQLPPRRPIDVELVSQFVRHRNVDRVPSLRGIAVHTARHFAVRVADLRSASRRQSVVVARGMAMYIARQLTGRSLARIGAYFGGRDHTTVSHGCRKTEALMRCDPTTRNALAKLRETIASDVKG